MIITLTDDEVRQALLEAAEKKTHYMHKMHVDNLYFNVVASGKDVEDIHEVTCSIDFG
jgi:hypothetical protein